MKINIKKGTILKVIDPSGALEARYNDIVKFIEQSTTEQDNSPLFKVKRIKDGVIYSMYYFRFEIYAKKEIKIYGIVNFCRENYV